METQSNVHTEVHSCDSDCGRNYCSPCKKPQRALFNYCTDKSADPWKLKRGRGVGGGGGENFRLTPPEGTRFFYGRASFSRRSPDRSDITGSTATELPWKAPIGKSFLFIQFFFLIIPLIAETYLLFC